MLSRREFLRASALIAAGVVAADQLEVWDRLAPRRLFTFAPAITRFSGEVHGIMVARAGDVRVELRGGSIVTFRGLHAFQILPVRVVGILPNGSTVGNVLGGRSHGSAIHWEGIKC